MHPIKRYRTAKGLTQTQLAQALGVSFQTVNGWEGGRAPWPKHITKLAEVLGVESLQLINEIEMWKKEEKPAT